VKHAWPILGNPTFHLLIVALACVFLRFLAGPTQPLSQ